MIPLWAPRFSPTLATAAAEIESNAPGRFRRFTDDNGRDSTCIVRKSILIAGQTARSKMLFPKDTPLLLRAATSAILAVATLLVLVPCVCLFFAVSSESTSPHLLLLHLPLAFWAAWALVSLWVALDSSRLWRVLGRPVDPLGTQAQALWGALLGALNIGASMLVVMSRASR